MKKTTKSTGLTSFHGSTIDATVKDLKRALGDPSYTGAYDDKVQNEWEMEDENGHVFTIYDWKEYRSYTDDEFIEWHIGGHHKVITDNAMYQLQRLLSK